MAARHHRHGAAWVHVRPLRPPRTRDTSPEHAPFPEPRLSAAATPHPARSSSPPSAAGAPAGPGQRGSRNRTATGKGPGQRQHPKPGNHQGHQARPARPLTAKAPMGVLMAVWRSACAQQPHGRMTLRATLATGALARPWGHRRPAVFPVARPRCRPRAPQMRATGAADRDHVTAAGNGTGREADAGFPGLRSHQLIGRRSCLADRRRHLVGSQRKHVVATD